MSDYSLEFVKNRDIRLKKISQIFKNHQILVKNAAGSLENCVGDL